MPGAPLLSVQLVTGVISTSVKGTVTADFDLPQPVTTPSKAPSHIIFHKLLTVPVTLPTQLHIGARVKSATKLEVAATCLGLPSGQIDVEFTAEVLEYAS